MKNVNSLSKKGKYLLCICICLVFVLGVACFRIKGILPNNTNTSDTIDIDNVEMQSTDESSFAILTINKEEGIGALSESEVKIVGKTSSTKFDYILCDDGYYKIGVNSRFLDIIGANIKSGTKIWLHNDNGTDAQRWKITENEDGYFYIETKNSDVVLGRNKEGELVLYNKNEKESSDMYLWVKGD